MEKVKNPNCPSSQMLFGSVRIVTGEDEDGIGTGFFFRYGSPGEQKVLTLVTSHHVVAEASRCRFQMHETVPGGGARLSSFWVNLTVDSRSWIRHPTEDLCVIPIDPASLRGVHDEAPFLRCLEERHLPTEENFKRLFSLEDVTIVGYPFGVWDSLNNLPILRRGTTATDPEIDYEGQPHGLVDIAAFPGCSGAPVMILNDGFWSDSEGIQGGNGGRLILLGILTDSMTESHSGVIEIKPIEYTLREVASTAVHVHLGRYVKARALIELKQAVYASCGLSP